MQTVTSGGAELIKKATIRSADGKPVSFDQDVFVHQDDVRSATIKAGVELQFDIAPDPRRAEGAFRAVYATKAARELAMVGTGSYALTDPEQLYVPPTTAQAGAPSVAEVVVQKAVDNQPLKDIPRSGHSAAEDEDEFLGRVFPQFNEFGVHEEFDRNVKALIGQYRDMGMDAQAMQTEKQAGMYANLRTVLNSAEDLLQPASILPLSYLPDLFMVVPVWYRYTEK